MCQTHKLYKNRVHITMHTVASCRFEIIATLNFRRFSVKMPVHRNVLTAMWRRRRRLNAYMACIWDSSACMYAPASIRGFTASWAENLPTLLPKAQNWTNRSLAAEPAGPGWLTSERRSIYRSVSVRATSRAIEVRRILLSAVFICRTMTDLSIRLSNINQLLVVCKRF